MNVCSCKSPIGTLQIITEDDFLTNIRLKQEGTNILPDTPLQVEVCQQLSEYFSKQRKRFDLPIKICGTTFQLKVWEALQTIPYGQIQTYKFIAEKIGNIKAIRAVGQAIHHNPIPIIIPCHRVIGSNGTLTGYASGLEIKQHLLNLENEFSDFLKD